MRLMAMRSKSSERSEEFTSFITSTSMTVAAVVRGQKHDAAASEVANIVKCNIENATQDVDKNWDML